jgi:SAM-dependent methyltransferase
VEAKRTSDTDGVGRYYTGQAGTEYDAWQQGTVGDWGGALKARAFTPYVTPASRVLDFGCGGGELLQSLDVAERVGIEPNPAARRRAASLGIDSYASNTRLTLVRSSEDSVACSRGMADSCSVSPSTTGEAAGNASVPRTRTTTYTPGPHC